MNFGFLQDASGNNSSKRISLIAFGILAIILIIAYVIKEPAGSRAYEFSIITCLSFCSLLSGLCTWENIKEIINAVKQ
jgi:hypothetical protein